MATLPVGELAIIDAVRAAPVHRRRAMRLSTSADPDQLVKTHCCFCGQQCGIQLKVRDNEVIGFEPWEEFPVQPRHAVPEGREALPAGIASGSADDRAAARPASPRRLLAAWRTTRRSRTSPREIDAHPEGARQRRRSACSSGASLTTEKTYLHRASSRACA